MGAVMVVQPYFRPTLSIAHERAGIVCPVCGAGEHGVKDSRPARGTIRRRRKCQSCNHRWTTYEIAADLDELIRFDAMLQDLAPRDLMILRGVAQMMRRNKA